MDLVSQYPKLAVLDFREIPDELLIYAYLGLPELGEKALKNEAGRVRAELERVVAELVEMYKKDTSGF